jgi:hypothetical protein
MSEAIEQIKTLMNTANIDSATVEKIMDKFIIADRNLILKTDLENPLTFTALMVIQNDLKRKGLKESAKTLEVFCDYYIKCRVSNKRMSRKEILDAISAIKREQSATGITAKLLGMNDKEKK